MKIKTLKALIGKNVGAWLRAQYCHVDRVLALEDNLAIVTVLAITYDGKILHWILEAAWTTNSFGVHRITSIKILKEDELYEYPAQNEIV